jgi:hypothetical protein
MAPTIDLKTFAFAVGRGRTSAMDGSFEMIEIHGTAIPVAPQIFVTAAHVVTAALESDVAVIGHLEDDAFWAYDIIDHELFLDFDVAVVRATTPTVRAVEWVVIEQPLVTAVTAVGFPYALNAVHQALELRAFSGRIVSGTKGYELPARPRVYELSFPCPRGLSGAALTLRGESYKAIGVILGNRVTDMTVYSESELEEGRTNYYYEKVESLRLGYALQAGALLAIRSRLLGGSIARLES